MDKLTDLLFTFALGLVVLAVAIEHVSAVHLVLAYLFLSVIAFNQYDFRVHDGISPLFSLQVALTFALGTVLIVLVVGGLGFRTLELLAVFSLLVAFVLTRDDLREVVPSLLPYLAAFALLFGIFLHHASAFATDTGLGLFPVFAGAVLALNCFVLPRYVSADAVYWATGALAVGTVVLALPTLLVGDYGLWVFEVRTWGGSVSLPLLDRELPVVRSIFANPNTFGLLLFPGTVAAAVATHRTLRSRSLLAVLPASALPVLLFGLFLSNSRASMHATAVAVGVYAVAATDRRLLPWALLAVAVSVPVFLTSIYLSIVPINPSNRFALWWAGLEAVYHDSGLLGQGIIGTGEAIEPYFDGGGSVHNSYLSVFIRAGVLRGIAYCLLVLGPIVHGFVRYRRVNIGMLSLAVGFAVHQLFEGYTLYQFGPGPTLGALAVGYSIASLTGDASSTPNESDSPTRAADTPPSASFDYGDVQYRTEQPEERS